MPLLLLDILRGRKVWEVEGEEAVTDRANRGRGPVCSSQVDREMARRREQAIRKR